MDGLLHITDMSWGRIKHPSEMLKVGQEIEVIILDVDMERERVSLGLKQATPNPWENIDANFPVGSRCVVKWSSPALTRLCEIEPALRLGTSSKSL